MRFLCRIGIHHRIDGESFRESIVTNGNCYCRARSFVVCVFCGAERISWFSGDWEKCREDKRCNHIGPYHCKAPVPHVRRDAR
jgi:hypothetical protein